MSSRSAVAVSTPTTSSKNRTDAARSVLRCSDQANAPTSDITPHPTNSSGSHSVVTQPVGSAKTGARISMCMPPVFARRWKWQWPPLACSRRICRYRPPTPDVVHASRPPSPSSSAAKRWPPPTWRTKASWLFNSFSREDPPHDLGHRFRINNGHAFLRTAPVTPCFGPP